MITARSLASCWYDRNWGPKEPIPHRLGFTAISLTLKSAESRTSNRSTCRVSLCNLFHTPCRWGYSTCGDTVSRGPVMAQSSDQKQNAMTIFRLEQMTGLTWRASLFRPKNAPLTGRCCRVPEMCDHLELRHGEVSFRIVDFNISILRQGPASPNRSVRLLDVEEVLGGYQSEISNCGSTNLPGRGTEELSLQQRGRLQIGSARRIAL